MKRSKTTSTFTSGFTIIEIVVVIVIIGILASITVVSYGAWHKTVASAQVRSDLNGAVSAMESSRTFHNIYPLTIPSAIVASKGVSLSGGGSVDGKTYCLDGTTIDDPTIVYYIDSLGASQGAQPGTCITRPGLPAVPLNLAVISTTGTQINLSWTASAGATSYTEQCASDTAYTVGMQQSTQATTTGSVSGLNGASVYYCHAKATNQIGTSGWSANVTATPVVVPGTSSVAATSVGTSQINLTWTVASNATSYQLQRATNNAWTANLVTQSVTGTSLSVTGLSASTTYYFRIQALNGVTAGSWSTTASATTADVYVPPPPPSAGGAPVYAGPTSQLGGLHSSYGSPQVYTYYSTYCPAGSSPVNGTYSIYEERSGATYTPEPFGHWDVFYNYGPTNPVYVQYYGATYQCQNSNGTSGYSPSSGMVRIPVYM